MPSGRDTWVWTGDIGAACGQAWEYGTVLHGTTANGDLYYPRCTWMDTDHGKDLEDHPQPITNRNMKIDMMAYDGKAGVKSLDFYCKATIFRWHNADPIAERPLRGVCCDECSVCQRKQQQYNDKRSLAANVTASGQSRRTRARNQQSAEHLIVNSRPQQSAITLCNSPTSRGSDFASTDEGLFCDMDTKILYPLCSDTVTDSCFDLDAENPYLREAGQHERRALAEPRYRRVSHWD
jgi:hypothetical protein